MSTERNKGGRPKGTTKGKVGKATPGQQTALGDGFSLNKFLTDWNKLGPVKRAMFSGSAKLNAYQKNLDRIANVSQVVIRYRSISCSLPAKALSERRSIGQSLIFPKGN